MFRGNGEFNRFGVAQFSKPIKIPSQTPQQPCLKWPYSCACLVKFTQVRASLSKYIKVNPSSGKFSQIKPKVAKGVQAY